MSIEFDKADAHEIAGYIKQAKKVTPVKAYVEGRIEDCEFGEIKSFGEGKMWVLFGENTEVTEFIEKNKELINKYEVEHNRRNSAIPLLDTRFIEARIEPGAIIRDKVYIGKNAVIMMGAVINIGAKVGEATMIDMNAVLGARATVGKSCHIGAGAVLAGVLEPPSADPVIIEDNVLVGANAVVLEGIRVGAGSVVAAGSVVTKNVEPGVVVAGIPARVIKTVAELGEDKNKLLDDLR